MEIGENAMGPLHPRVVIYLKINSPSKGAIYCLFGWFSAYFLCFCIYYFLFNSNFHSNVHAYFASPTLTPFQFLCTPPPQQTRRLWITMFYKDSSAPAFKLVSEMPDGLASWSPAAEKDQGDLVFRRPGLCEHYHLDTCLAHVSSSGIFLMLLLFHPSVLPSSAIESTAVITHGGYLAAARHRCWAL